MTPNLKSHVVRVVLASTAGLGLHVVLAAQGMPREKLDYAVLATVRVLCPAPDKTDPKKYSGSYSSGSGSIVHSSGLILTNYHVIADAKTKQPCNPEKETFILKTEKPREAAVPAFRAKVIRESPEHDLALLQIVADFKGNPLSGPLQLPSYQVGDSDRIQMGDWVGVIGFPAMARVATSVTYTTGAIGGFLHKPKTNVIVWFKTNAEIHRGNSGGAAVDQDGTLIGVPSAAEVDFEKEAGVLGQVYLVRPIGFAEPLLRGTAAETTATSLPRPDTLFPETTTPNQPTPPAPQRPAQPAPPSRPESGGRPSPSSGSVWIAGNMLSADTGVPIANGIVAILAPGTSCRGFDPRTTQVYDFAQTDAYGRFQLRSPILLDQAYSVYAAAAGFLPVCFPDQVHRSLYRGGNFVMVQVSLKSGW